MDKNSLFIKKVNELLKKVDYRMLDYSCNEGDKSYAKDFLKKLHDAFVDVYGSDYLDWRSGDFVDIPAVIRGEESGKIAIGLVNVDLQSAGEHWGSFMFTEIGVVDDSGESITEKMAQYIKKNFIPYKYWYTPYIADDHHVDFENIPEDVSEFLSDYVSDEKLTGNIEL